MSCWNTSAGVAACVLQLEAVEDIVVAVKSVDKTGQVCYN